MIKKYTNIILGFLILLILLYISQFILNISKIAFPAPLLGLIILTILLHNKLLPLKYIEDIANLLIKNITIFFIPLFVGIIVYFDILNKNLLPILLTLFISTFLTMIFTAILVETIIKYIKLYKIKKLKQKGINND